MHDFINPCKRDNDSGMWIPESLHRLQKATSPLTLETGNDVRGAASVRTLLPMFVLGMESAPLNHIG